MARYNDEPRRPWVWFGDGNMAEILRLRMEKNEDGYEGYSLWLRPTTSLKDEFGLKEGEDLRDNILRRWYYKEDVFPIRVNDPIQGKMLVYTDVNGNSTELRQRESYYLEQIKAFRQEAKILRTHVAYLTEKYNLITSDFNLFMENNVKLFNTAHKVRRNFENDETDVREVGGER